MHMIQGAVVNQNMLYRNGHLRFLLLSLGKIKEQNNESRN